MSADEAPGAANDDDIGFHLKAKDRATTELAPVNRYTIHLSSIQAFCQRTREGAIEDGRDGIRRREINRRAADPGFFAALPKFPALLSTRPKAEAPSRFDPRLA